MALVTPYYLAYKVLNNAIIVDGQNKADYISNNNNITSSFLQQFFKVFRKIHNLKRSLLKLS